MDKEIPPLKCGGDCSGLIAPAFSRASISRLAKAEGKDLVFEHVFASETPRNEAAVQFIKNNHRVKVCA